MPVPWRFDHWTHAIARLQEAFLSASEEHLVADSAGGDAERVRVAHQGGALAGTGEGPPLLVSERLLTLVCLLVNTKTSQGVAMKHRWNQAPEMMRIRRQTVEHPFGTLKAWMGADLPLTCPDFSTTTNASTVF